MVMNYKSGMGLNLTIMNYKRGMDLNLNVDFPLVKVNMHNDLMALLTDMNFSLCFGFVLIK